MIKRTLRLLLVLVAVAVAGAFAYVRFATHDVPAGQPPLAYLDAASLEALRTEFNAAAGETRMIVLLSPT